MNPAVSVHHSLWDLFNYAINWVSNILLGGHKEAGGHQDDETGLYESKMNTNITNDYFYLVVKPEDVVVDAYFVKFDETLH